MTACSMICSCLAQRLGSRERKQLATATLPGSGSWSRVRPNSLIRERRKAWGSWMRTPAPSPVVGSAPAAPRCSRSSSACEREVDHVVARLAVEARDAGDPARVVLEAGVVQAGGAGRRSRPDCSGGRAAHVIKNTGTAGRIWRRCGATRAYRPVAEQGARLVRHGAGSLMRGYRGKQ